MWGFNWIDGVIVLLLIGAVVSALRFSLIPQFCAIISFFAALFIGGWLFPHLLPIHDPTLKAIINGNLVLIFAAYAGVRGFDFGHKLHFSWLKQSKLGLPEAAAGVALNVIAVLLLVWLVAAAIGRLPFAGFSNSANDAMIVQNLDQHLPAVPSVFATFDHLIDPNTPSQLILQPQPTANAAIATANTVTAAVVIAGASTVRITSFGCGGVVSGSGFVIGPDLIATNAHVVAGVKRPIVKYQGRSYAAVPVLFNSNLDFALLRVSGLAAQPLVLAAQAVPPSTSVIIDGYPGGNYTLLNGVIRNNLQLFGRNIYDVGFIGRDVYEIEAAVAPGNSGSPAVLANGQVAGMVFAKSDEVPDDGYALTSTSLISELQQGQRSTRRVNTGVCLAN